MSRKKRIYYRANNVEQSYREGIETFGHRYEVIEDSYVKRFKNNAFLLAQLSKTERFFLDYLTEIMDDYNYVVNNKATREAFNKFMKGFGLSPYQDSTIHKCFSKLCKLELLLVYKGKRGMYQINPLFFHSDRPNSEREKLIREKLEEPNKIPVNRTRHRLLKNKGFS